MAKNSMTICKACGSQIASSAKVCPNCGAKNKKPIYKRPWFIILAILVLLGICGAAMGGGGDDASQSSDGSDSAVTEEKADNAAKETDAEPEEKVTYESVTAEDMMASLEANAASAKDTYEDKYFSISGKLGNIDSDGAYFDVMPDDEFAILGVQCYIQNDDQLSVIKGMSQGDAITVKGKVTDVGEVLGYSVQVDEIE